MEIYWYWPWPRDRADGLARATAEPRDRLTVQALDSALVDEVDEPNGSYTVVADLPAPRSVPERSPRWVLDRSTMLLRRTARRRARIDAGQFDVAHIHLLNLLTDSWSLRTLGRTIPLVSTVHDVRPHHRRLSEDVERRLLARTYRDAGSLIVYHGYLRTELVEHFDVDPARIHVIPHPIRTFTPRPPRSSTETPLVLLFGALRRNKGVDVLLAAAADLRSSVRFHIAGRGASDVEARVREAARRLPNVTADVRFIPNDERQRLYHAADLVVLPYTSFESQSGVLADAYSFGVPLVVTDVGALGQTVRADGTGWVVPAADPDALTDRLRRVMADEPGRRTASRRMERLAHERSEAATGRAFRAVYEQVLSG